MSDAKQATPHHILIGDLLDANIPKNEREHAAAMEIERLRRRIEELEVERDALKKQVANNCNNELLEAINDCKRLDQLLNAVIAERNTAWRMVGELEALMRQARDALREGVKWTPEGSGPQKVLLAVMRLLRERLGVSDE